MHSGGHRFPPEKRAMLRSEERREQLPPEPILRAAGVAAGETVVEVGAGTGYWIEPLAALVGPEGRVFALDVEPVMLDELRALTKERRLQQVEVLGSDELSIPLDDGVADLVLLAFVLHEPPDTDAFLTEIVRLLKPEGRVLVIDWHNHPTASGPPLENRISMEEARALLGAAGLSVRHLDSPTHDAYILLAAEFHPGEPRITVPTA